MDIITLLPLLSAFFVAVLGVIVFYQNKTNKVNYTFSLFALAITVWMVGTFMMFLRKDSPDLVVFWDKIVYVGVVCIPVLMYQFGLALTNNRIIKSKLLLWLGYALSTFFLLLIPTGSFVDEAFLYKWGAHAKAQLFHHFFLVYFAVYIILWFVIVYKYYKTLDSSVERERIRYSFLAFFVLSTIGSLGYLPAYGIGIYPFAYLSGLFFVVIVAYAIIVHHLMDIRFVMRKYSVYIVSLLIVILPAVASQYFIYNHFKYNSNFGNVLIITAVIAVYPSIRNYIYKLANKYFFSSLYDNKEVIASFSEALQSSLDVNKIYREISNIFISAFHTREVGVLIFDKERKEYFVQFNNSSRSKKFLKIQFRNKYVYKGIKLGERFQKKYLEFGDPFAVERFKIENPGSHKRVTNTLDKIGAEVLVPLAIKKKVLGILVLGKKESRDIYNQEDLYVLKVIGTQMAIAIENALLYQETKNFNIRLKKEIRTATIELVEANEKLKKLDKAKSEFISIASHQLRTPLTVIKGYISMMLDNNFGELKDVQRDSLSRVFESNERLILLVEDLLNISRIESGRIQYDFKPIRIENVVDSVYRELSQVAKKKNIKFMYKRPKRKLPKANLDEEKVRQAIMNFADNAIKYTEKGSVTLHLEHVGNKILYTVTDTGFGVKSDDLPHLFEKFSRGTGTFLIHTEGTGLGLYVAKEMIEAHGGRVWAESEGEGKGSKFCFEVPVAKKTRVKKILK